MFMKSSPEEETPKTPENGHALLPVVNENGRFRPERWQRVMRSIEENSPRVSLRQAALTREVMYSDHD